jgi:hypothetical protein
MGYARCADTRWVADRDVLRRLTCDKIFVAAPTGEVGV